MEGFYKQKEGGARELKEWVISGKENGGFYQADDLTSADQEIQTDRFSAFSEKG